MEPPYSSPRKLAESAQELVDQIAIGAMNLDSVEAGKPTARCGRPGHNRRGSDQYRPELRLGPRHKAFYSHRCGRSRGCGGGR